VPNENWAVVQPFETLAACEGNRSKEFDARFAEAKRRAGNLDETKRSVLAFIIEDDKNDEDPQFRRNLRQIMLEHDLQIRDAAAAYLVATMVYSTVCVASDDPRVRNSTMLSLPPSPPLSQERSRSNEGIANHAPAPNRAGV